MAYATRADVQALAPHLTFGPTTKPTDTQVDAMIADAERLIDATLVNLGYVVPVTATTSKEILRDLSAHGALARVLRAHHFGIGELNAPGAEAAQAIFDKLLKRLGDAKDPLELPDAARTSEAIEKDGADLISSHVQGLTRDEFDASAPPVTHNQVF